MQWGDMSFKGDKVSEFLAQKKSFDFKHGVRKLSQLRKNGREDFDRVNLNSRQVKLLTLMEIHKREKTEEALA